MEFLTENVAAIAAALVAVVSLINKLTTHWGDLPGPAWQRVVLLVVEFMSLLTSRGKATRAGPFKLPLTSVAGNNAVTVELSQREYEKAAADYANLAAQSPSQDAIIKNVITLTLFLFIVSLSACATVDFASASRTTIGATQGSAKVLWEKYFPVAKAKCMAHRAECKADDVHQEECAKFVKCRKRVHAVALAVEYVYNVSDVLQAAIAEYEILSEGWRKQKAKERVASVLRSLVAAMESVYKLIAAPLDLPPVADAKPGTGRARAYSAEVSTCGKL